MGIIRTIMKNDLRLLFSDVKTWIIMLLAPVLALWAITAALGPALQETGFMKPFAITLTDQEQSVWSSMLAGQLERIELMKPVLLLTESEAVEAIRNGRAKGGFVIPVGLSDSVNVLEPLPVTLYGSTASQLEGELVLQAGAIGSRMVSIGLSVIDAAMAIESASIQDQDILFRDLNRVNEEYMRIVFNRAMLLDVRTVGRVAVAETNPLLWYASALIPVFLMLSAAPVMKLLQLDRESGVLARYAASSAGMALMVIARLMLTLLISLVQSGVILLAVKAALPDAMDPTIGMPLPLALALLAATVAAASAFSLLVATAVRSAETIDLVVWPGVLVMAAAGGCIYPLSALPDAIQAAARYLPTYQSMNGFLALFGGMEADVWSAVVRLLAISLILLLPAVILLMGRRRLQA